MESFLLFLYTSILSVLIAFLLGKLFTDDAAADHDADGVVATRDFVEAEKIDGVGGDAVVGLVGNECSVDGCNGQSCSTTRDVNYGAVLEPQLLHDDEKVEKDEAVQGVVVEDKVMAEVTVVEQVLEGEVMCHERDVKGEGDDKVKEDCEREGGEEEVGSLLQGEDEWEGIERTELEKNFGVAVEYVSGERGGDAVSRLGHDVQMQLYGLHKVATEGPCYESQPMTLKVSPRAKWYAWQRLGAMNPEVAMEQYISILTDSVPGWTREIPGVNVDQKDDSDLLAVGLSRHAASDSRSSFRLSEDSSDTEGGTGDVTAGSNFKQGNSVSISIKWYQSKLLHHYIVASDPIKKDLIHLWKEFKSRR